MGCASWIPAPVTFRAAEPKEIATPPNRKTGRRNQAHDWIAEHAPEAPACFDGRDQWVSWLCSAHDAGERVCKSITIGRTIDYCEDCSVEHKVRMRTDPGGNRCFPVVRSEPPRQRREQTVVWITVEPVYRNQLDLWEP